MTRSWRQILALSVKSKKTDFTWKQHLSCLKWGNVFMYVSLSCSRGSNDSNEHGSNQYFSFYPHTQVRCCLSPPHKHWTLLFTWKETYSTLSDV